MSVINFKKSIAFIGSHIEKSRCSHITIRKKDQRIELKTFNNVCSLKEGTVSVFSFDMLTTSISAPAIIGLAQMSSEANAHYLHCDTECKMHVISVQNAIQMLSDLNLHKNDFDVLSRHFEFYLKHENLAIMHTSGIVVRVQSQ